MWDLEYQARPWLVNAERAGGQRGVGGHRGRATLTREWRDTFARLAQVQRIPPLEWFVIEAIPVCRDRRRPDVGSVGPAAKAAIDGLIDAGIAPDDSDDYLHALTFRPALILGYDALRLRIDGVACSREECDARERTLRAKLRRRFAS